MLRKLRLEDAIEHYERLQEKRLGTAQETTSDKALPCFFCLSSRPIAPDRNQDAADADLGPK